MIIAFIGWLAITAAIGYGTFRLTRGNYFYVAAFTAMTLFAPPIGISAFALFFFLRIFMPPIKDAPISVESDAPPSEHAPLQKNLHYAKQLEEAQSVLQKRREAFHAIEIKISAIDPAQSSALDTLKDLEAEKAESAVKMIAAEEAYERLKKLQH